MGKVVNNSIGWVARSSNLSLLSHRFVAHPGPVLAASRLRAVHAPPRRRARSLRALARVAGGAHQPARSVARSVGRNARLKPRSVGVSGNAARDGRT